MLNTELHTKYREFKLELSALTFHKFKSKLWETYKILQVNQRLYVNAIFVLCIYLIIPKALNLEAAKGFLGIFVVFWLIALVYDAVGIYTKIYKTVIGKASLLIIFTLCTNFAIVLSGQTVNEITGIDPSKFPHTVILLSVLSIPFFVSIGLTLLFYIMMAASGLFFIYHLLPEDGSKELLIPGYSTQSTLPYKKITRVVQFFSFVILSGMAVSYSKNISEEYNKFFVDTARSFLYEMEMYPKAQCAIEPNSRVAFMTDDKVLLGIKNAKGLVFIFRDCKI